MPTRWFALLFTACLVSLTADSADRTIYRCVSGGVTTFSDRPCGETVEVHSLDVPTAGASGPVNVSPAAHEPPRRGVRSTQPKPKNPKDTHAVECKRLASELRRLAARMRAGYTAPVGERLRDQQRAARARRQELRCR